MRYGIMALVAAMVGGGAAAVADTDGAGFLPYRDAAAVARGAVIYADFCASCHGAALEGEPGWQVRDAEGYLPAPPHDPSGHTWHHPDAQLFAITKYGIEALIGGGYKSRMAGYEGILSDAEIAEVLAYIKSTWPERVIGMHNRVNADADPG